MNSSNSGAGDRNGSTTNNSATSNINNDSSQTEETTSNTDTNPYADDFKNISDSDEPVPQTVVEARQGIPFWSVFNGHRRIALFNSKIQLCYTIYTSREISSPN